MTDSLFIRLAQLSDSALPIGSAAHSFGLEALIGEEDLNLATLPAFLEDYLSETGLLESVFCGQAGRICTPEEFLALNNELSARMPAQAIREASLTLGRRFFSLAAGLIGVPHIEEWQRRFDAQGSGLHLCTAFGAIGAALGASPRLTILALLHHSVSGLVSACQRLLPLGQTRAAQILWELKPGMIAVAERAVHLAPQDVPCFTCGLELASMRHSGLPTRLFIS